ncbi:transcription intermediary factor 1-beta [Crotalus adamanteus]|uniref:Transcription intermediary factor 1-beta n=1 Tax=Crotalus adamanteus TaxID=8729 RepID=A0AAW1B0U7_CROAD
MLLVVQSAKWAVHWKEGRRSEDLTCLAVEAATVPRLRPASIYFLSGGRRSRRNSSSTSETAMAASGLAEAAGGRAAGDKQRSSAPLSVEGIDLLEKCGVCRERLRSERDPRLLPCLHTVCKECIKVEPISAGNKDVQGKRPEGGELGERFLGTGDSCLWKGRSSRLRLVLRARGGLYVGVFGGGGRAIVLRTPVEWRAKMEERRRDSELRREMNGFFPWIFLLRGVEEEADREKELLRQIFRGGSRRPLRLAYQPAAGGRSSASGGRRRDAAASSIRREDSGGALGSSPTKPTTSSELPGYTPPLRDFCTIRRRRGQSRSQSGRKQGSCSGQRRCPGLEQGSGMAAAEPGGTAAARSQIAGSERARVGQPCRAEVLPGAGVGQQHGSGRGGRGCGGDGWVTLAKAAEEVRSGVCNLPSLPSACFAQLLPGPLRLPLTLRRSLKVWRGGDE